MAEPLQRRELEDRYLQLVREHFEHSKTTFSAYFNKLQRRYDLYRGSYKTVSEGGWNDIHIPLLFSVVQSDVARKLRIIFGGNPVLSFVPTGGEDQEKARRMERLVDYQLYDAKTYQKGARFLLNADLYGTSIYKYSWKSVYGSTRRRGQGAVANVRTGSKTLRFNGPWWEHKDSTDFFPFPGIIDIEDMPGVVDRYYMEFEDIRAGAELGPNGEEAIYDEAQVRKLGENPPSPPVNDERALRRNVATAQQDESWLRITKFSKPVEILEYWGRVPDDMSVTDEAGEEVTELLITVADRKWVLNAIPNPHWDRSKPFGAYRPFEDPHFFHPPGKADVVEKLQVAMNRLANSRLDLLDLTIFPPMLYNENSGLMPRRMFSGPGAMIGVNGSVAETEIRQMQFDLRGAQLSFAEGETIWKWMQQATGIIEDVSQGVGASDRQTAREFMGRAEAVSTRLEQEVRLAEVQWMEPLGNAFVEMNRQYLPLDTEVKMIGSHAIWDTVSERIVPPEQIRITQQDLDSDYDVRATGATRSLGRAQKVAGLQQAAQILAPIPQVASTVNWRLFVRQYLAELLPNVDQVMNTEQQQQQALMMAAQMNAKGAAPSPFVDQLMGGM